MELASLLGGLSLENNRENCEKVLTFSFEIAGTHTDFVIQDYENCHVVIVTQYKKIGGLMKVDVDTSGAEPIYSTTSRFGPDSLEYHVAARFIAEILKIQKQLLLFMSLKDYSKEALVPIAEILLSRF